MFEKFFVFDVNIDQDILIVLCSSTSNQNRRRSLCGSKHRDFAIPSGCAGGHPNVSPS